MYNGKTQVLSRLLQVVLIVAVIVVVFVMLFDRNSIEAGRNYTLLEGSYITETQEESHRLDEARRGKGFKDVLNSMNTRTAQSGQHAFVLEVDQNICKIDSEGYVGYISCQSIIK